MLNPKNIYIRKHRNGYEEAKKEEYGEREIN